ncbi:MULTISPECIES: hypothetical protein [unclassified Sporosarcina]|uniref:hypothetical protein n=1 Tax=unclassified Sporosarcina TaxID=2647733 RepID=UPI0020404EA9|nr:MULTISPECIES: hypothetical protein [unclassified Sporosarcina]GKV64421.1 hypothetical protein NCCP2331_05740 [Sporosarcina sp. NCCP-2331]GLB55166.1 hypothetical protein NCCP2378_09520 [Sporosarcina sp. NCCP-2378]
MKLLTNAILLRILLIFSFALNMYGTVTQSAYHFYFQSLFYLAIVLLVIEILAHRKRNDGRIVFKGNIIPDLAPKDEREVQIVGEAYKIAFSTVFVLSFILIIAAAFLLVFGPVHPLIVLLGIAILPISGFIAFYLSYRYNY